MDVSIRRELALEISGVSALSRPAAPEEQAPPQPGRARPRQAPEAPAVSPPLMAKVFPMPQPDAAQPLHETMLSMLHEARLRGMAHEEHSLPMCELLLEIHAPAGELAREPCAGCREPWPCRTALGIIGGLIPATGSTPDGRHWPSAR